jgi:ethanolamine kinase
MILNIINSKFNNIEDIIKLTNGITNEVYKVITKDNKYIIKFFGDNTDILINRENENTIISYLNKYDIGPKIIEYNQQYRIEEYIDGYNIDTQKVYQKKLAKKLKYLHDLPKIDIDNFWDNMDKFIKLSNRESKKIRNVINRINKLNTIWNELVIGHGDLTLGNILFDGKNVKLIDFEYSCLLPRGFEIANHLCEYNDFNINIDLHIENSVIKSFIESYLNTLSKSNDIKMIRYYIIISHYYWGCWALIQSTISNIDFNYKEYSIFRFKQFDIMYNKYFI